MDMSISKFSINNQIIATQCKGNTHRSDIHELRMLICKSFEVNRVAEVGPGNSWGFCLKPLRKLIVKCAIKP